MLNFKDKPLVALIVPTGTGATVGGFAGDAYYFFDSSGNQTTHALLDFVDASGKEYRVSGNKILGADDTEYTLNKDKNLSDKYGNPLMYVLIDADGNPVYDGVYEPNGTGDGSNAVDLATLFNINNDSRFVTAPLGTLSVPYAMAPIA